MAKRPTEVTLSLDDCEPNALPPVCCKCGKPATCEKEVKFKWHPMWINILAVLGPLPIAVVLMYVLRKRRTAFLPTCDRHSGVWNWGVPIMLFTVGATVLVSVAVSVALSGVRDSAGYSSTAFMGVLGLFVLGFAVGLLVVVGQIIPKFIGDDDMKLVKLNPAFVEAVEAQQDAEDEAYEAKRAARKPA